MSRSYKKHPVLKDNGRSKKDNRSIANRVIRRKLKDPEFEMGDGSQYQKHFNSYDIHDYVSRWTLEQALEDYRNNRIEYWRKKYPTEEEFIIAWKKEMVNK